MSLLAYIHWNVDPEIFSWQITEGFILSIRYYSLLFASAFLVGYYIGEKMFALDKLPKEWVEKCFMYVIIAAVVGARLGHVIFYGWDYYSQHPEEILKVWHGGLASHGGAIGIIIALYYYSKKVTKKPMMWAIDRVVVPTALAGAFIRLGNLFNSEIIGRQADVSWAFIFERLNENPPVPRHPTQIYEAICYLITFGILMFLFFRTNAREKIGFIFGVFMIGVFVSRFVIEFLKENQEAFEEGMSLNMGQWLSIPFILAGVYYVVKGFNNGGIKMQDNAAPLAEKPKAQQNRKKKKT